MLKSLQGGRGLAALAVAAYHLSGVMEKPEYLGKAVFTRYTDRGYLGVDFFFVLSGFIILFAHNKDIGHPDQWTGYALKRFVRVYPFYWILTLVMVLAVSMSIGHTHLPSGVLGWVGTMTLVRFSVFTTPLEQAWTLFHEVVFYVAFSALIFNRRFGLMLLAVWGLTLLAVFHFPQENSPLAAILGAYNLNFFFGMGAFLLYAKLGTRAAWVSCAFGVALLIATLALDRSGFWMDGIRVVYAPAFAAILCGAAAIEQMHGPVSLPVLGLIGDASYSIYLTHAHLEAWALRGFARLHLSNAVSPKVEYAVVMVLTVAIGCVVHTRLEKPLLQGLRGKLNRKSPSGAPRAPVHGSGPFAARVGPESVPIRIGPDPWRDDPPIG